MSFSDQFVRYKLFIKSSNKIALLDLGLFYPTSFHCEQIKGGVKRKSDQPVKYATRKLKR